MSFQRGALILVGLVAFAGCGSGEQMTISLYGEGTGDGDIWITNDEDQAVVGSMDASITMEGQLAADSHVELSATAHPGSHFVSFGGDCSSTNSPLQFQLTAPMHCSVRFDQD